MKLFIGIALIVLSGTWFFFKEFARGMASNPSAHRLSHVVEICGAIVGVVFVILWFAGV